MIEKYMYVSSFIKIFWTIFICFMICLPSVIPAELLAQQLYLNEVLASNGNNITDEDGDNEDWIEIVYLGDEPLNLEGYGLSDDNDRPFRWVFPDITIQSGEYLLIWTSGKDRSDLSGELHTNYSISAGGEEIILTTPDGERIDELEPTEISTDISLGRYPNGTGEWYFYDTPTPNEQNGSDGYQDILDPVSVSHQGGFYSAPFELELTHPDPEVTIYYTLDGSEPDPEKAGGQTYEYMDRYRPSGDLQTRSYETLEYSAPISIEDRTDQPNYLSRMQSTYEQSADPYYFPSGLVYKGTVVRSIAVKEGGYPSQTETHSYFITDDPATRFSLPVLSFAIQEDKLFDYEEGIYVPGKVYNDNNPMQANGHAAANYNRRGIEWERTASMELFGEDTAELFHKQTIGVRIHGAWSRSHPIKSLRLYARSQYGDNRFSHPMFPDQPYNEYNRLILRNSGNDWEETMFRDALMQEIVKHMDFDTQAYQPYIIFINGEYWGLHNMRERFDKHYLARVHHVDPENIDLLEGNAVVKEGDNVHYHETFGYIRDNGLSDPEHYDYIRTRIDVENYIDYQIAQIFVGNTDWPGNNIDFWRYRAADGYNPDAPGQMDGRWRWLAFDLDFGFHLYGRGPDYNTLLHALGEISHPHGNPEWSVELFNHFMENEEFQQAFINRFLDQLNSAFLPERTVGIVEDMADYIQPEMQEHIQRWNTPSGGINGWENRITSQLIPYAQQRPAYSRQHLKEYFEIDDEHDLTVDVSDPSMGSVRVNTISISGETPGIDASPWPWTGTYFEGIPVTLTAEPMPGYRFSHWDGIDAENHLPKINRILNQPLSVTAVFEEDPDANLFPAAFSLYDDDYFFSEWPANAPAETYPENMAFVYMDQQDPGVNAEIEDFTDGVYDLDSRTRINGLGGNGFVFINTGNEDGNPGYPGTQLGGAILSLNTQGVKDITVHWEGSTIKPNSRVYNLRLQYRIGNEGDFADVTDQQGNPVEYERNETEGHRAWIGPVTLPEEVNNKGYVQLLWRYYYTGDRMDEESGQRSEMAVSAIKVEASVAISLNDEKTDIPDSYQLAANYPNPFNPSTVINYQLPENNHVRLEVFDITGRRVAILVDNHQREGRYQTTFDATGLASGIYIYRMQAGEFVQTRQMVLVK